MSYNDSQPIEEEYGNSAPTKTPKYKASDYKGIFPGNKIQHQLQTMRNNGVVCNLQLVFANPHRKDLLESERIFLGELDVLTLASVVSKSLVTYQDAFTAKAQTIIFDVDQLTDANKLAERLANKNRRDKNFLSNEMERIGKERRVDAPVAPIVTVSVTAPPVVQLSDNERLTAELNERKLNNELRRALREEDAKEAKFLAEEAEAEAKAKAEEEAKKSLFSGITRLIS